MQISSHRRSRIFLICVALVLMTAAAFAPVCKNDFIRLYDDGKYVTDNPHIKDGINLKTIRWVFSTPHYFMWHPLTTLSYVLEYQLFGLTPFWYHLTNLVLHAASALLLFWVLQRMTGAVWPSAFVAAVFALHPIQVESVAWIAERKNVLNGFFWLLTIAFYVRYVQCPGIGRYAIVLFVFGLSAMTKPTVVTLPFALLLLDYWPLRRFGWVYKRNRQDMSQHKLAAACQPVSSPQRLIIEKIPLFIISILLSIVTYLAQQSGNVIQQEQRFPLYARLLNAIVSYIRYVGHLIYPIGFAVFYPHPGRNIPVWQPTVSFLLLAIVTVAVLRQIRRRPYLAAGWFWYVGTLVPVIGLVQAGGQATADRYAYIPLIGISIMIAWAAGEVLEKWGRLKIWAVILAGLLFFALLTVTRTQVGYWQNDETLFSHAVKVTQNNHLAHYNLAKVMEGKGEYGQAIENYKIVVEIHPDDYEAYNNMGAMFLKQGQFDQAVISYEKSLKIKPDYLIAMYNAGIVTLKQGKYDETIKYFHKALEQNPDWVIALNSLAWVLATAEDSRFQNPVDAVKYAEKACRLANYNDAALLDTLAAAYASVGNFDYAVQTAEKAFKLADNNKQENLAQDIQYHLEFHKTKQPWRENTAVSQEK